MTITRADQITQNQRKLDTYSDFSNNLAKHPVTKQLVVLKNEDAVRQAFKNMIYTNLFARFFNPFFGTNIEGSLFELDTPFLIDDIKTAINVAAVQFEPRVSIDNLTVANKPDQNGIAINIVFRLVNSPNRIELPLFIKRVR